MQDATLPSLTIDDFRLIHSMIEVCIARGAFKPNELILVGNIWNTMTEFLKKADTTNMPAASEGDNAPSNTGVSND